MKIIRYRNSSGQTLYAQQCETHFLALQGDPWEGFGATEQEVQVTKLLAPVVPSQILCIGLNYRHHAEESGAPIPERPILFVKGNNTLQNPGDPIEIPTHCVSSEVDYEC